MNASDPIDFPHYAYPFRYSWEDGVALRYWSERVWVDWRSGFLVIAIYWLSIYLLKELMRGRSRPLELRWTLFAWNVLHASVSAMATWRGYPEQRWMLVESSVRQSLMFSPTPTQHPLGVFWAIVYGYCKLLELGDTAFLVLRKKNVSWLHLFHHSTVFVMTALCSVYEEHSSLFRIMGYGNCLVHAVMYTYFAVASLRIVHLPRTLAMCVTVLQIAQMVFFLHAQHVNFDLLRLGVIHKTQRGVLFLGLIYVLNWANLGLFCNFFYRAYLRQPKRTKAD